MLKTSSTAERITFSFSARIRSGSTIAFPRPALINTAEDHDLLLRVRDLFVQFITNNADEIDSNPLLHNSFLEMAVTLQDKIARAAQALIPRTAAVEKKTD